MLLTVVVVVVETVFLDRFVTMIYLYICIRVGTAFFSFPAEDAAGGGDGLYPPTKPKLTRHTDGGSLQMDGKFWTATKRKGCLIRCIIGANFDTYIMISFDSRP